MRTGLAHHQAHRLDAAERDYRQALELAPDNADLLHMLGMVCYARHRLEEAGRLVLKAGELSNWQLPGLKNNLGLIVGARLGSLDATRGAAIRKAYRDFLASRERQRRKTEPLVSIIIPSYNHADYILQALDSVYAQTYRHIELYVIDDGSRDHSTRQIQASLGRCPFPNVYLPRQNCGAPQTINEAAWLSKGEYIAILNSDDAFEPDRIRVMVEAIADVGADWGFTGVHPMDSLGAPIPLLSDKRSEWIRKTSDIVLQADSRGFAFLEQNNVAVSTGNLFFSKRLFRQLGGFHDFHFNHDWDFCLRATWLSEPVFVPSPLYRYRLHDRNTINTGAQAAHEEMFGIFKAYHDLASCAPPSNPYAPSYATFGHRYFSKALELGMGGMFPLERLRELNHLIQTLDQRPPPDLATGGINILGYLRGEFGLADSARILARACLNHGIPVRLRDSQLRLGSRQSDTSMDELLADSMQYRATLLYMNPDQLKAAWNRFGAVEFAGQYRIGFWYWEIDRLPQKWLYALDLVDEIWVASDFVRRCVATATDKPVVHVPHPIVIPSLRPFGRSEFGLPDNTFLFLASFDFNSAFARKNPLATIQAFRKAFPDQGEKVGLVIKSSNGRSHPGALQTMLDAIGGDPRIHIIDRRLDTESSMACIPSAMPMSHSTARRGWAWAWRKAWPSECRSLQPAIPAIWIS